MICPGSAHTVIAAESGKPKGLLRAEQCTGDFNLQEIWVIPPCTEIKSVSQKEEHLFEAQGLEKALGCLDRWHPSIHQRGLTAGTCSEDNTCQWVTLSTIPVLLMPASGKWQLQPLNTKSVHNYRGVNSAASSHIVMAFPNWGMCSAKSHCSQWHLHWSLFRKKGASLSIFCFVQYHLFPTLLQERPSGTCLTLPRVGSDQPKADKAHGGGLCLCL